MTLPVVSVIIPTVDGREDHFERCQEAYTRTAEGQYELNLIVVRNEPTCGWGWQKGTELIDPASEYLHFTCDDIEPLPGWAAPAIKALGRHVLPAPRVLNGHTGAAEFFPHWGFEWGDGTPAGFSALPFISRELWDGHVKPLLTTHYDSDTWFTYRASAAGYPPVVVRGYAFKHHWADHLRGAGMGYEERLAHDRVLFGQAIRMAERGEWTQPWPPRETPQGLR